jgi:hypothetical protein
MHSEKLSNMKLERDLKKTKKFLANLKLYQPRIRIVIDNIESNVANWQIVSPILAFISSFVYVGIICSCGGNSELIMGCIIPIQMILFFLSFIAAERHFSSKDHLNNLKACEVHFQKYSDEIQAAVLGNPNIDRMELIRKNLVSILKSLARYDKSHMMQLIDINFKTLL